MTEYDSTVLYRTEITQMQHCTMYNAQSTMYYSRYSYDMTLFVGSIATQGIFCFMIVVQQL